MKSRPSQLSPSELRPPLERYFRVLTPSGRVRLVRFAMVGAACALVQLLVLVGLKRQGLPAIAANIGAYLFSAQVNFLLSNSFVWRDRRNDGRQLREMKRRWISFHGSIVSTFLLAQAVFIVGRFALPDVVASALGIGLSALLNFIIQDRLTFRRRYTGRTHERLRSWAEPTVEFELAVPHFVIGADGEHRRP